MSLPNRAGIITPMDSIQDGEDIRMLVMLVMLND
jgi:DNA polymerase-3 subunit beta